MTSTQSPPLSPGQPALAKSAAFEGCFEARHDAAVHAAQHVLMRDATYAPPRSLPHMREEGCVVVRTASATSGR